MQGYYRSIIQRALDILWRYKYLWFFGIFASFASNGEEYDILFRNLNSVDIMQTNLDRLARMSDEGTLATGWNNITTYLSDNLLSAISIGLAILAILFLIIWLMTVAQASIVAAAARDEEKKKVTFLDLFWNGHRYFWRIFLVNLYAKLILFGTLFVIGIPLAILYVNTRALGYALTLGLVSFFLLVPVSMIFSFITKYATAFIVTKEYRAMDAFRSAWNLFFQNWLVSLEMALLLFFINFVISYLVIALLAFGGLPFSPVGYIFFTYIIIAIGSVLAVFQFSAWTLLYMRLGEGKSFSKLARFFAEKGWFPSPAAAAKNTKL